MSNLFCTNGHDFQPRYDVTSQLPSNVTSVSSNMNANQIEALKVKKTIYLCDICTRCGLKVTR